MIIKLDKVRLEDSDVEYTFGGLTDKEQKTLDKLANGDLDVDTLHVESDATMTGNLQVNGEAYIGYTSIDILEVGNSEANYLHVESDSASLGGEWTLNGEEIATKADLETCTNSVTDLENQVGAIEDELSKLLEENNELTLNKTDITFNTDNINLNGELISIQGIATVNGEEIATKADLDNQIGDIETALDEIIAIQNSLIGGDEV